MTQDQERAAFEAWAIDRWHSVNRTAFAWEAWQARAALAAPQPAPAPAQRVPLTNDEIYDDIWLPIHRESTDPYVEVMEFARAILAAQAAKDRT